MSTEQTEKFYKSREKIYPRETSGIFQKLRAVAVWALMGMFYLLPWIQWEGHQAILFDLPERKFYIFSLIFWPQDFIFLAWLLIILAVTLFYFTSMAGRLWCGYACPQTVWTEVFLAIERIVEGDRNKRMRLDKKGWTTEKIIRKGIKHSIWIILGLWTGFTFVGFFTPITDLGSQLFHFQTSAGQTFWVFFYGFATWGNAGFLREQVCLYMCPYARFQSAMFDKDTLIISYDEDRGEPRGKRKKSADHKSLGLGDCINCMQCVQVCPTGIDIRDGLQYECIGCAACIDVCDQVMEKLDYPKGLIKYTTQHAIDHKTSHVLRPRTIIYTILWLGLIAAFLVTLSMRKPLMTDIIRDRTSLYREVKGHRIENTYTMKIMNKSQENHQYKVAASGIEGLEVNLEKDPLVIPAGELLEVIAHVTAPAKAIPKRSNNITFTIEQVSEEPVSIEEKARFLGPKK
ncbi:MAG: cytochrome c oxidase accessory protein CcoG [bacterium]